MRRRRGCGRTSLWVEGVNPETLAPKIRLEDPRAAKPVGVTLETSWESPVIGFRTEAVQKEKDERTVRLVIAGT